MAASENTIDDLAQRVIHTIGLDSCLVEDVFPRAVWYAKKHVLDSFGVVVGRLYWTRLLFKRDVIRGVALVHASRVVEAFQDHQGTPLCNEISEYASRNAVVRAERAKDGFPWLDPKTWREFGNFIAGEIDPVVAFLALAVLVTVMDSQERGLKQAGIEIVQACKWTIEK